MKKLITVCIAAIMILGCDDNEQTEVTLIIKENKTKCTGLMETECYLVQQGDKMGTNDWEIFYDEINGFNYEPGFTYKLVVVKETIDNPPMDSSSTKYTLLKQLSKVPR